MNKDQSERREEGDERSRAKEARRSGRGIGIGLAMLSVAGACAWGAWYSRYDPPLERAAGAEWMAQVEAGAIQSLVEPGVGKRWLEFGGVDNARDLGGYPTYDGKMTRWGTVFRSGRLRDLSEDGCAEFRSLGIRTVIDLRNRMVVDTSAHDGDPPCVQSAASMELFRFIPPRKKGEGKAERTRAMIRRNTNTVRGVLETLADADNLPLLYHCTAGKDRAGIISYFLLELLGVDRRVIRAEYDLSGGVGKLAGYEGIDAVFADIDEAGGIHQYLHAMEVSFKVQRRVRENLLTDE